MHRSHVNVERFLVCHGYFLQMLLVFGSTKICFVILLVLMTSSWMAKYIGLFLERVSQLSPSVRCYFTDIIPEFAIEDEY